MRRDPKVQKAIESGAKKLIKFLSTKKRAGKEIRPREIKTTFGWDVGMYRATLELAMDLAQIEYGGIGGGAYVKLIPRQ